LYTVKSGETISSIAKKFHMTTGDLKSMNNLRKNYVKPKQKLFVYTPTSKDKVPSSGVSSTYIPSDTKSNPTEKQSPEEETVKSPETEAPKTIHVVKSGESLGLIAGKYKCSVDNIKQWNSLKSTTIQVGQKLKVTPGASAQTTASRNGASQTSKSTTGSNQKYSIYTIQSGDNLWDIANKFDVTVAQLKNLNNLKNSSRLKPGQKLKIPK
jgi:LysM repeat protein